MRRAVKTSFFLREALRVGLLLYSDSVSRVGCTAAAAAFQVQRIERVFAMGAATLTLQCYRYVVS